MCTACKTFFFKIQISSLSDSVDQDRLLLKMPSDHDPYCLHSTRLIMKKN